MSCSSRTGTTYKGYIICLVPFLSCLRRRCCSNRVSITPERSTLQPLHDPPTSKSVLAPLSPLGKIRAIMRQHLRNLARTPIPYGQLWPLDRYLVHHGSISHTSNQSKIMSVVLCRKWEALLRYTHITDPFFLSEVGMIWPCLSNNNSRKILMIRAT